MIIEVLDVTSRTGESTLMASKVVTYLGNQPHNFQIKYGTKLANQQDSYKIDVKIVDKNGVLLLTQQAPVYATTENNPTSARVDLNPTSHLTPTDPAQQDPTHEDSQQATPNRRKSRPSNQQKKAQYSKNHCRCKRTDVDTTPATNRDQRRPNRRADSRGRAAKNRQTQKSKLTPI